FLMKDLPAETLFEALRVIAAGEALLAPGTTRRLIAEFARLRPRPPAPPEFRDCAAARPERRDREDPREPCAPDARTARPGAGRRHRLRVRSRRPRCLNLRPPFVNVLENVPNCAQRAVLPARLNGCDRCEQGVTAPRARAGGRRGDRRAD